MLLQAVEQLGRQRQRAWQAGTTAQQLAVVTAAGVVGGALAWRGSSLGQSLPGMLGSLPQSSLSFRYATLPLL